MVQHVTDVAHHLKRIGMDRLVRARQVHPNMPAPAHVPVLQEKPIKMAFVHLHCIQRVQRIVKTEIQRQVAHLLHVGIR